MVTLQLRQLVVYPGQRIQLQEVDWPEFEAILDELGDKRASRIAYSDGILEIRMPLPKHEKAKVLIGDMVKILLEELDIDNECFGSSTLKRQDMAKGIEPDDCFYIENANQMIGKDRLDLTLDPPPDLAIEVDVTSKTGLDAYQVLGVLELWRLEAGRLQSQLPERDPRKLAEVLKDCPELEFIIDGTERRINRPKDSEKRDKHYSGKKKATTVKNNVITERRSGGKVKYLSETVEGKRHDKKLADDENYSFPEGSKLWQDTGFQGYVPENVVTLQPKKKPKGGELTTAEKERNRELSSQRITVEHHLGGIKRSRIVHDTFRNRKEDYVDIVMETACGLHNFRVSQRQVSVA